MKHKILTSAVCCSVLALTACGGGSSSSSDQYIPSPTEPKPTTDLDYTKSSNTDLVTIPVVELTQSIDNTLFQTSQIAEEIHYSMTNKNGNNSFSCTTGTAIKNSNGSITLNNCKDIKFGNVIFDETEDLTLSGTIFSTITDTTDSEKYAITLNNFTLKSGDGESVTYNGNTVETYIYNDAGADANYNINKLELTWSNGKDTYTVSDYSLTEKYSNSAQTTPAVAQGTIVGEIEGKKFGVKFDSNLKYNDSSTPTFSDVSINIISTIDNKNSIKITNTTNGKASIQTTANAKALAPRIVDWDYFY